MDYYERRRLNAQLDELLGARFYTQTRGGFTLCVRIGPGEQADFERLPNKPQPEGFAYVTGEKADEMGFFGNGIPDYCRDPVAMAPLIDAYGVEQVPSFHKDGTVSHWDAAIYPVDSERGEQSPWAQANEERLVAIARVLVEYLGGSAHGVE